MYHSGDGASIYDIQLDATKVSDGDTHARPAIVFPDEELLFNADFKRIGVDLLLSGDDKKTAIIFNYFKDDRRAHLATLEGATLSGASIEALAGSDQPERYAQATLAAISDKPIGRVEKASGSATVLRNGVPVELRVGDTVSKGDVVQTGPNSSLMIKFSDGTVFGLSSNARIVLNDMVYTAGSDANSAFITLVQGVIGFVAGQVAKTGDLKVETPVATMAIRGTAVRTEISAANGTTKFSLLTEPDGKVGSFLLLDKYNLARVITTVSSASVATIVAPSTQTEVRITQLSKTANDILSENDFARDLFMSFSDTRQRRGSSDFDGIPTIVVSADPTSDHFGASEFSVSPYLSRLAFAQTPIITVTEAPTPVELRGTATEDGPFVRLVPALQAAVLTSAGIPSVVYAQASLPPGVTYLEDARTFSLDPSHPTYQHLAAGETATVTVNYSLFDSGILTPASASWIITGQNDAPVAGNDRFSGVSENGARVLAIRANDSDIDTDALRITNWTQPLEGSVSRDSSGNLVFNPEGDFRALSAGETATVSFAYTVSDGKGGTDSATATVQVHGAGTFSAPRASSAANDVLVFNHQPVSLTIDAPSRTTTATVDLGIAIGLGAVFQPQMNILYAVDVSGSTTQAFAGTPVGDLNLDGLSNTVLDAEIAGLIGLTERVRSLGFSPTDISITVIPFNGSANPADDSSPAQNTGNTASITFGLGSSGDETVANFLRSLDAGGGTNFEAALQAALEKLQTLDQGGERNFVYFLSDGDGTGAFADELAALTANHQASITAVGIGGDANLSLLETIDNTGGAELVTSTDQLNASLIGPPIARGQVIDVDVFVNGTELPGIGREDLVPTSAGFELDLSIGGLARQVGDNNIVSASIMFASGETLTTRLNIAGTLPLSADIIL